MPVQMLWSILFPLNSSSSTKRQLPGDRILPSPVAAPVVPPVVPVVPVVRPVVVWTGRSYACDCQCPVVQATIWEADIQASATRQAAEQRAATANAEREHLKPERAEQERRAREELPAASFDPRTDRPGHHFFGWVWCQEGLELERVRPLLPEPNRPSV